MPVLRLAAEGVGPFQKLDLDFSDGRGNPHLGPHILAGVNGSGKSTALRAIAWVLDFGRNGFQHDQWRHSLARDLISRALLILKPPSGDTRVYACIRGITKSKELELFVKPYLSAGLQNIDNSLRSMVPDRTSWKRSNTMWSLYAEPNSLPEEFVQGPAFNFAAYAPSRSLQYLDMPDLAKTLQSPFESSLGFESTIQNEALQAWMLGLYSKRAIARERGQSTEPYTRSLHGFQKALRLVIGEGTCFDVEIEPRLQPRLRVAGHNLNFSQLPDGIRNTVGWLADFMARQDEAPWYPELGEKRPGILLLDEVDAHLHPLWQRRILPAMREALPDVQIIVASHSPFVIASCPGSRVHVLELENGKAHARPPVDAPIGASVTATLKDIFGVESRFDIDSEKKLNEWNEIKRQEARGKLRAGPKRRLQQLTEELSARSEELRSTVGSPPPLSRALVHSLTSSGKNRRAARR